MNKSALEYRGSKDEDQLSSLLMKSETVLEKYRTRYEAVERENKVYKRKYQEALKKIKNL